LSNSALSAAVQQCSSSLSQVLLAALPLFAHAKASVPPQLAKIVTQARLQLREGTSSAG